ncbi:MAG: triosephosphate isomerase [Polyangiales bacterium]|jgi:triosephosphate isomerase
MNRRPLIAGNWKLNNTIAESTDLAEAIAKGALAFPSVDVLVAPVATSLHAVASSLASSKVFLAAQNTHEASSGAFTGELSPVLIKDVGCSHCIVGHSERRQLFGETSEAVGAKVVALLAAGVTPIVCVGETLEEREADKTLEIVLAQLTLGLGEVDLTKVIVAYEPVWAIGTGRTAAPEDAQAVHAAIRAKLGQVAHGTRILYGGSVKPGNAAELMAQPDIDGALVGGASLKAESFLSIIEAAS